jgi:predicted GNAT family acetyltransferase
MASGDVDKTFKLNKVATQHDTKQVRADAIIHAHKLGASRRGKKTWKKTASNMRKDLAKMKDEAVDPEERKLRLKKIRAYADRQGKAGRLAHDEYQKSKDPKVGNLADKHSNRYLHADQLIKHKSGHGMGPGGRAGDAASKKALDYFRKLRRKTESSRHRKAVTRAKLASEIKSLRTTRLHLGTSGQGRDQQDNYATHVHDKTGNSRGHLSYSHFRGKAHINMVDVPKALQGRGLGKKLLRHLHKEYRPKEVNYGYSTPAGSKLIKSYKKKYPDG